MVLKREFQEMSGGQRHQRGSVGDVGGASSSKGKFWSEDDGGVMDELLADMGYKVKQSGMMEVVLKIEQLYKVMRAFQDDWISQRCRMVFYNPFDVSGWIESILSESKPLPPPPCPAGFGSPSSSSTAPLTPASEQSQSRPVVVSLEAGVRLVHTLMACAEAIQGDNLTLANELLKQVVRLADSQAGSIRKVAGYFAEALARRIYRITPHTSPADASYSNVLQYHFYGSTPYLKFAHLTANQAILEAFAGAPRVHVIDFGINQGMQWPALLQALAVRPGGPPVFRLTGIGPPQPDNMDALQQVGWKLARFAEKIGIEFHYQGYLCDSLTDLEPRLLDIRQTGPEAEVVAVNTVLELHPLLARPGAVEKVLTNIKGMKPKIVTVVEQEANHNEPVFVDRFNEALHYYSSMFDSLESGGGGGGGDGGVVYAGSYGSAHDLAMSAVYLGRQICNVVTCEGPDRVGRHETLAQWRVRMESAGFDPVHLGSSAFKQGSMLLALLAGGDGYKVEESHGCLMLGWHTRPLISISAWRMAGGDAYEVEESHGCLTLGWHTPHVPLACKAIDESVFGALQQFNKLKKSFLVC